MTLSTCGEHLLVGTFQPVSYILFTSLLQLVIYI